MFFRKNKLQKSNIKNILKIVMMQEISSSRTLSPKQIGLNQSLVGDLADVKKNVKIKPLLNVKVRIPGPLIYVIFTEGHCLL